MTSAGKNKITSDHITRLIDYSLVCDLFPVRREKVKATLISRSLLKSINRHNHGWIIEDREDIWFYSLRQVKSYIKNNVGVVKVGFEVMLHAPIRTVSCDFKVVF